MENDSQHYVLTVADVAQRLDVHPNTVLEMIHQGAFRARLVGRSWRIPVDAFQEFLDGRDNPSRVLSIDDLAAALAVHRNTAAAMIQAGTIRAVRAGRTWKIPFSALDEFLAGRDNEAKDQEARPAPEHARLDAPATQFTGRKVWP